VDFGTYPNINVRADDTLWPMVHTGRLSSYWGINAQKQVAIKWATQFTQSALVILAALGLLWVSHPKGN
jgi:hypothetical protein